MNEELVLNDEVENDGVVGDQVKVSVASSGSSVEEISVEEEPVVEKDEA